MSDVLLSPGFLTWTKGPAAFEKMKMVLSGLIESVWKDFLDTLSFEEIEHLQQFIKDANDDLIEANKKKKKWIFHCGHSLCQALLDKLNSIRQNPNSMKIVWNTGCQSVLDHQQTICETYYWHVANMFMLYGTERNENPRTNPKDTDIAMILKMMKNCTLFDITDNALYDEVINIRNRIFHTGSYNVSKEEMKSFIRSMNDLLNGVSEMPKCSNSHKNMILTGIKELRELAKRDVVTISAQTVFAVKALEVQKQAILQDINTHCTASLDTETLNSILKTTDARIQELTNSDEWQKSQGEDESRRREEEDIIKEPLNRKISDLEDLLQKERDETTRLRNKIGILEERNNDLQTRLSSTDNLAERMSDSGAISILGGYVWWHCSNCKRERSQLLRRFSDLEEVLKEDGRCHHQ